MIRLEVKSENIGGNDWVSRVTCRVNIDSKNEGVSDMAGLLKEMENIDPELLGLAIDQLLKERN